MKIPLTLQRTEDPRRRKRRGAIAVLAAFLIIPLMGMVALAIDYAYLLKKKTELQRAADAAAMAAVRDLVPDDNGQQNLPAVRARVKEYAQANLGDSSFTVRDDDITIGRYDRATVYTNFTILDTGTFDTVRVTLRNDNTANSPVGLFFARVLGIDTANVSATATAILPRAALLLEGADILPFAVDELVWDNQQPNAPFSIYGDGKVKDEYGTELPGNWGTLDIGADNNSTDDIKDQIRNGLRQYDLDALYASGRITTNEYLQTADVSQFYSADPGWKASMQSPLEEIYGREKLIPIYSDVSGNGENAEYRIVKWGVVRVKQASMTGPDYKKYVKVTKVYTYDGGNLRAQPDLSYDGDYGVVEGGFAAPQLVE